MDLNPVAFRPFAQIPQIPQVDLIDTLKTYGDADSTLSTSASVCALAPSVGCVMMSPEELPEPIALTTNGTS